MVAVNSTMLPLGTVAPDFRLPDTNGKMVALADFAGRPLLVMFICNHCPYVKHIRAGLAAIGRDFLPRGAAVVAISSNDAANYPQDGPEKMKEEARRRAIVFRIFTTRPRRLRRRIGRHARRIFIFSTRIIGWCIAASSMTSRPGNGLPVTGKDLRNAMDAALAGKPISTQQKASIGCNIKWKHGSEPDYFG